jgi:predicted NBD/HSP70 family sugar kinase
MRKIDLTSFRVASSETARQINRRIALSLIRHHPPMSRADLARRSGLQRSTVSAIIDQLIEEGWVTEGVGHAPRGRRPRLLHLNVERAGLVAVEVRPERTTVGLACIDARFVEQTSWPTPPDADAFVRELARTVETFRAEHPRLLCEGLGVSLPGRVDAAGRLVFAPNLRWGSVDLRARIEEAIGLPVALENAANACALAELWFGRHPEHVRNLVAVTVSEGIGVGLLLNGQLIHGGGAMAGEFGHLTLDEDGPPCPCGKRGCWERYASNSAALQYYAEQTSSPDRAVSSFAGLLQRLREGDAAAGQSLDRMARFLGIGLAGLVTGLNPEVMVIIGDVTSVWDRVGPIVTSVIERRSLAHASTRIVATDPVLQPRLRGAATLVIQQHFGAPNIA